ncbi:MAG: hypothetical protein R3A78_16240 [Polyangiales bacterium]
MIFACAWMLATVGIVREFEEVVAAHGGELARHEHSRSVTVSIGWPLPKSDFSASKMIVFASP